ncbi:hypothetical protein OC842_002476, partial [Tilletia horrida]
MTASELAAEIRLHIARVTCADAEGRERAWQYTLTDMRSVEAVTITWSTVLLDAGACADGKHGHLARVPGIFPCPEHARDRLAAGPLRVVPDAA